MKSRLGGWLKAGALIALVAIGYLVWQRLQPTPLGAGFASGNGRIEAVEVDVAAKVPGRVQAILVDEGDFVTAGQQVAQMDTEVLTAQWREAEARLRQAESAVATARSQAAQRESEKKAAEAVVAQRMAELDVARKRLKRAELLAAKGVVTAQDLDDGRARAASAEAALNGAKAQVVAMEAAIVTAQAQVTGALAAVEAGRATIERLQADIDDSALKAPRDGRVQYRIAQPGEVVGAGSRLLNVLDLTDVYMTFFLPTAAAGRLAIGSEVRLRLDAAPEYVIPAQISFVADVAQFTPKTVETASEREKLMFRVKARIAPELLKQHLRSIKTGLPGMAYVRIDPQAQWPEELQVKLPQ